jgi:3',5'-cyclic AMP phosphodiesterase CpdA
MVWRIAQVTDIHIGEGGYTRWHNRMLLARAVELVRATVGAINEAGPDFVVVTGDLTQRGLPEHCRRAREVLDDLYMPYYVLPGNHDLLSAGSHDAFYETFADRLSAKLLYHAWTHKGVRCLTLPHAWSNGTDVRLEYEAGPTGTADPVIPDETICWLESQLAAEPRLPVLLFSHYPLVPMAARFRRYQPKYAEDLLNRDAVREILVNAGRVRAIFCGHQHYNQITHVPRESDRLMHCMLAATVEYPMAWREIAVSADALEVRTHLSPVGEGREMSLDDAAWVCGDEEDRHTSTSLHACSVREGNTR